MMIFRGLFVWIGCTAFRSIDHLTCQIQRNLYPFASILLALSLSFAAPSSHGQENKIDSETGTELVAALKSAATQGFFTEAEQYDRMIVALSKFESRDFDTSPLTQDEITELEGIVKELRETMPKWMDQLIQNAKAFETRGEIQFKNPNWQQLSDECIAVGSPGDSNSPLDDFIEGLEKVKKGQDFDWGTFEKDLGRDYKDCQKQLNVILEQVVEARKALEAELEQLAESIKEKEDECRLLDGEDEASCQDELDELYEQFEDKTETQQKMKEFEDDAKKTMALLGILAIIAGVAIGIYCCPELGASIAAWGGQTLEDNVDPTEEKAVTETKITGRKRVLEQEGEASPEDRNKLEEEMKKNGFEKVSVNDPTKDGVAYEIFSSDIEIRLYLVKSKKLLAKISNQNTTFPDNSRLIYSISALKGISIDGDPFIEDNRIKLNIDGTGPDGEPIRISISEKSVGSKTYSLAIED